ncbi:putative MFS transporter [Lepidopterella palustris CBS 459.81]|uniref:Putative MFS transporter n=1 Tax=Lepidopterella palustris CBS 459.81 TaxID=1314670 RepID=A0A8E2E0U7_9PEZI|nr:putative MFS transporter [Lepidopterella palustris CBS 459.81]
MNLGKIKGESITAPVDSQESHTSSIRSGTDPIDLKNNHQKPSDLQIHTTTANDSPNTTPSDDPEALTTTLSAPLHTVFTRPQRTFIAIMITLGSFFSPLSGQIYFPAIPAIANDYHTTTGRINLTITTYMIMQGLAPTIMGTFGDTTGRRPAYILTFAIYFAANIGLATQKSYAALLVLRCLQSAGSSGTIALGYGVISDIVTPAERGKYLGPAAAGVMLAPAIGPTIGGLLTQYLGWRSIFWFLSIISGSYLVTYALFMPETSRKVVGDGSIPPSDWWVMSPFQYWSARREKKRAIREGRGSEIDEKEKKAQELAKKRKFQFPNPLSSVVILREKDVCIIICFITLGMFVLMAQLASLPTLFGEAYGFNTFKVGLCYLPVGGAAIFAAFLNGKLMDWNYRRWAKKLNLPFEKKRSTDLRDFPIEKVRLQPVLIFAPLVAATYIPFGWVLQKRVNLAVPLTLEFIMAYCQVSCSNSLSSLLIDLFPEKPSTVTAASSLVRCWVAGAGTAVIAYMLDEMGWGWCYTFLGLVFLLATSLLWVEYKWGMGWREGRRQREERKMAQEEEQKT